MRDAHSINKIESLVNTSGVDPYTLSSLLCVLTFGPCSLLCVAHKTQRDTPIGRVKGLSATFFKSPSLSEYCELFFTEKK